MASTTTTTAPVTTSVFPPPNIPGPSVPRTGRGSRSLSLRSRFGSRSSGPFSPRKRRALSQDQKRYLVESWGDIVNYAPSKDASPEEVRTWMLMVLHRRSHLAPETILEKLQWSGRDLHRATYLALRHRLRAEPDGMVIAHDIHDAAKESRHKKRSQKGQGAQYQA
ncbi:hypothetical protein F5B20DRAFT_527298 [Whalleya microplaca]|nr:hypothetical protein F5B20DRAFT_527298 [Whalleya microplaca]